MLSGFTYKGMTITELWRKITPVEIAVRICVNCTTEKPVDRFKGKDKTCLLCRKLISVTKTRYSHKMEISQLVMLDADVSMLTAVCRSCDLIYHLEHFPRNSFECDNCFGFRSVAEVVRIGESYDGHFTCLECEGWVLLSEMPFGRLICRPCINRRNGSCA
jgi:hypothetical protein